VNKIFGHSINDGALMKACFETASRTMFDSEPESSKIREIADRVLVWFRYMLEVLIELAYPGEVRPPKAAEFLADIEKGLRLAR
jgi:hypothetical protein